MNKKAKTNVPLKKDESDFVEKLMLDKHRQIERVIYNVLGPNNNYFADDTIDELYLRMCQNAKTLMKHECPEAWIITAARRTALEMKRKHEKDLMYVPLDSVSHKIVTADISEEAIYNTWEKNKVPEKLIAGLTKREQEVYYKIYIENKKPKDVAKELNISVNTLNNIHKNLRDKIKDRVKRKNF